MEAKGVVCCPVDKQFANGCVLTKHRKCNVFITSLMHACPCHGSRGNCVWLIYAKKERTSRRFKMGTCHLRQKTLSEHQSSRIAGGWLMVLQPNPEELFVVKSEEINSDGGQGPHRAVEPITMMMTMMMMINKFV